MTHSKIDAKVVAVICYFIHSFILLFFQSAAAVTILQLTLKKGLGTLCWDILIDFATNRGKLFKMWGHQQ